MHSDDMYNNHQANTMNVKMLLFNLSNEICRLHIRERATQHKKSCEPQQEHKINIRCSSKDDSNESH